MSGIGLYATGALTANNGTAFGNVVAGDTSSLPFTYSVTGNKPARNVRAQVSGADLSITSSTCGTEVSPLAALESGTSCQFTVAYAPGAEGALNNASVSASSDLGTQTLSVTGFASAALQAGCVKDTQNRVWCLGQTGPQNGNQICGYPSNYNGTYYAVDGTAAQALGRTIAAGSDCATNYTNSGGAVLRSALSCWTNAQRWARSGDAAGSASRAVVRCTNME